MKLKDDLKRVIENSTPIPKMQAERIAQAIIDRLEIDQAELLNLWAKLWANGKLGLMEYEDKHFKVVIDFKTLAKSVAKAKPIKLKEINE